MKVAGVNPNQLAQAQKIRGQVEHVFNQVKGLDNGPQDLSPKAGEVLLAESGKVSLQQEGAYLQDVVGATVNFDPASQKLTSGSVDIKSYYKSSYGDSAPSFTNYSKETRNEKDGWHGLFGKSRPLEVFTVKSSDVLANHDSVAKFDTQGNLVDVQQKNYVYTYGECLKDMVTTPAGIGLTLAGAALCAVPGSLGNVVAGPVVGGLVGGSAVAFGLAFAKWHSWNQTANM